MVRRIRGAMERRDAGTTLTEVLVVMLILGIVVAATASLTITLTRTTAQNTARQDQIDVARVAVERLSKTTRTAVKPSQLSTSCQGACAEVDAFLQGTASSMSFYANLNNDKNLVGPSRVTYSIASTGADAGVLIEKVQVPDQPTPSPAGFYSYCPAETAGASSDCKKRLTVRRLATGVVLDAAPFAYFQSDGVPLPVPASGLSATDLEKVMGVEVRLKLRSTGANAPAATTYIQRITLPNAQAILQGEDGTP
jgi:type II secretory pathway pseudopilin PulG